MNAISPAKRCSFFAVYILTSEVGINSPQNTHQEARGIAQQLRVFDGVLENLCSVLSTHTGLLPTACDWNCTESITLF